MTKSPHYQTLGEPPLWAYTKHMNVKSYSRRSFIKTAATTAAAAGALSTPAAFAKAKIKWKMVTTWPKNFPGLGTGANYLAQTIGELSGGRMSVKVYGAKELVPALGVFDAVSRGTAEMGHGAAYYWKGKHEASQFFAAVPFGFTSDEMNAWLIEGGGYSLWKELYAGFGLIPFAVGNTGVQMGGWYNKKINKPTDYKGLKIRMPGLGGDVLRNMGATVVTLPGGEIFQALKSGAVDACEWIGPYNDLVFGFYKAAKYYYWPGWHEPGTNIECMVNKKAFEKLPEDLQKVVQYACDAANLKMISEFSAQNANALHTLETKHKVQLSRFNTEVLKEVGKNAKIVVAQIGAKDPFSKKVYGSFEAFRRRVMAWSNISSEPYSQARETALS